MREQTRADPGDDRQDETLGEEAAHDADAGRAERLPQRQLTLPDHCPRNQQVGDVGTDDRNRQQRDDREDASMRLP